MAKQEKLDIIKVGSITDATIVDEMKKSYLIWNKDAVTDDIIFKDLEKLSSAKLTLSEDIKLNEVRDILQRNKKKKSPNVVHLGNSNYSSHKNY